MMIVWRQSRGSPRPRSRIVSLGAFTIIHGGPLQDAGGVNIVCSMNVIEPGDTAVFNCIVEVLQGNDGVMWKIMRDIMYPVDYAIMQSDENDS